MLAGQIRRSSNFRFSWQFYQFEGFDPCSSAGVRESLSLIIDTPHLHRFLRDSFADVPCDGFEIEPLHEHCHFVVASDFESILARAAADRLGAYSVDLHEANLAECALIGDLFRMVGEYQAFELMSGNVPGCAVCRTRNNELFSTWFYGVAWDWCFIVTWPKQKVLWLGCLTDTD